MSMELNKESVEQAGGDERAAFEVWFAGAGYADNWNKSSGRDLPQHEAVAHSLKTYGPKDTYFGCCTQHLWEGWQARAALAQPSPVRSSLLINGYQLRAALDFIAPDGTAEQLKSEACIEWRQQDADFLEAGLYAFCAEYPEEGGVLLDEEPTTAQPSPLQSEQAEAERPEVVARVVHSNPVVLGQCGPLNANDELMTVAQHAASVARWAEMFNRVEQERDAALARVADLERQEPVATVAKVPGEDWNSLDFHRDLQHMQPGTKLYAAPVAQAQHSDQSELRRIAVALTNPLLNGQEASDLMVRYEALTMPDHIIALIDSQAQYIAPDELRAICMLVAEAGIKYGRGRDRAVASDECREVVDSVLPLEPSPSNSEQHCEPEIMAVAEGVLTFMRSEKEGSHCTCCNGPHIFCRYFEGMSDFDDITRKARFRNDLEGRTFRLVLELLPAALSGKEGL
ncbi:hypothetical protein ACNATU_27055 [Pseudomonas aeruginosa]|uniref:hypothetical protein n=1 Tax=Pseudomonas aeruginosa TaxID=287 RepID=UPI003A4E5DBE